MSSPELTPNSIPPELNVERLSRSALRFESTIAAGIKRARDRKQEIDDETGTLIAHVLGRGLGRDSDLAEFARTQTADPAKIEQECSAIYGNPSTPLGVRDWITWLGTYLTTKTAPSAFADGIGDEPVRPQMRPQLYADELTVRGEELLVHLPPTLTGPELQIIAERLGELPMIQWPAFRAFLTLSDVDGSATNLAECFGEVYVDRYDDEESLLHALSPMSDWETELGQWTAENGLPADAVEINRSIVLQQTHEVYDIVERDGVFYAFNK